MYRRTAGFSLIELTLVLALVGVVAAFGVGTGLGAINQSSVAGERDLFVSLMLRGARATALANVKEVSHGIKIDTAGKKYILFDGTAFSSSSPSNRNIPFSDANITVTNTGGSTIVFEQLSGSIIAGAGTITISDGTNTQTVTLRSNGQIDW